MQEMRGHEVCIRLKKDPETAAIPVLFLTGLNSPEEVKAEMEAKKAKE